MRWTIPKAVVPHTPGEVDRFELTLPIRTLVQREGTAGDTRTRAGSSIVRGTVRIHAGGPDPSDACLLARFCTMQSGVPRNGVGGADGKFWRGWMGRRRRFPEVDVVPRQSSFFFASMNSGTKPETGAEGVSRVKTIGPDPMFRCKDNM